MTTKQQIEQEQVEDTEQQDEQDEQEEQEQAGREAREKLEASTADRLKNVFSDDDGLDDEDEESEESEESTEAAAEESESEADDDSEEEHEEESDEEGGKQEESASDEQSGPTIPDAYRRSLKAYGWQDDEIDNSYGQLGDSFLKTAERIHNNRNRELAEWAAAGRKQRQETAESSEDSGQSQAVQKLQPVDTAKLKEQWGDDEVIDSIVGPVNQAIEHINNIVPQLEQGQRAAEDAEIERINRDVDRFFSDESLQPYHELYGTDSGSLNEKQVENRTKVLDTAWNLMAGAAALNRDAPALKDALTMAHDMVASEFKEQITKANIKKQATKRKKSMSMKPTSRTASRPRFGKPSRNELESKVRNKLSEVFSNA